MANWYSSSGSLTAEQTQSNANIVINTYRQMGFDDRTIAGILGNMQAESGINPGRKETGGSGYGLVQWTPGPDVLIEHCQVLGLSPYTSGDVQLQVIPNEIRNISGVAEWYTTRGFISNYYNSGATPDMVGITGEQFLSNAMGWNPDKLAIMFMAGYERPSYNPNVNHYQLRMSQALAWFEYMGGVIPPTPGQGSDKKRLDPFPLLFYMLTRR